jgi:hypothetical protein
LELSGQLCQCPHAASLGDATVQADLVLSGDNTYCECPAPSDPNSIDTTTQILLVWNSGDKWCECPNIDTLPDPTRQVKTTWDSSALVCKCPDTPDGAIGLVLFAGTPVYCECPNPTLDPTIEVPLTLSGTDSCVCPAPDIANITREVNLVIGSGNDRCVCPTPSANLLM